MLNALGILILVAVGAVVLGLIVSFVLVPVFKGIGWLLANLFRAVGWLVLHVFEFVGGVISDVLRLVGALLTMVVLLPFAPLNVILGRWSAAGHFASSIKRECKVAGGCLYRVLLRRPLKLFWLHGVLEGVEQRLPEAMAAAPTSDKPSRRTGQFTGYNIVGSLRGGGSGAKLYIAEPDETKRRKNRDLPDRVVIKSFALTEGSSLPQIVRESRALECAKHLGLVLEHGMDDRRFFYVMPYHAGEHLGVVTRQLHGESSGRGLEEPALRLVLGYIDDLLVTLATYHRGGLWHKDVKPDNVIFNEGHAHLVDLGLVTPLGSAMTLTTHGTEYFRDPEMVRQALRGVKVHQVDGTKFDIFAVGAVLYFMLENTFPAHGGLSRHAKKSPESIRWIIRRAMADYNQRYTSADEMLADVRAVAASRRVYECRPVDLPSMRGETPPPAELAEVAYAGTPVPPPVPEPVASQATPDIPSTASVRPRLRVTNWWTGEYSVEDHAAAAPAATPAPVAVPASVHDQTRAFRDHSRAMRDEAHEYRRQVRDGAMSARKAAREQIKSARSRAKELQKRAHAHRHRAMHRVDGGKQPGIFLGVVVLAFMLGIGGAAVGIYQSRQGHPVSVAIQAVPTPVVETGASVLVDDNRLPVLLVVDGPQTSGSRARLKQIVKKHEQQGRHVVLASDRLQTHVLGLWQEWEIEQQMNIKSGPADMALEDLMEQQRVYGLVRASISGNAHGEISDTFVYSERDDADERRRDSQVADFQAAPVVSERPMLLVNDHPAKASPAIGQRVKYQLDISGFTIIEDDLAEAEVRQLLPTRPAEHEGPLPARLSAVLSEHGLGGLIYVGLPANSIDPQTDILIKPIPVMEMPDVEADVVETVEAKGSC